VSIVLRWISRDAKPRIDGARGGDPVACAGRFMVATSACGSGAVLTSPNRRRVGARRRCAAAFGLDPARGGSYHQCPCDLNRPCEKVFSFFIMKQKYEKLIPRNERETLENSLQMDAGYVLDFSDRTFNDFFYKSVGIDPEAEGRLFNTRGTSKAKRLRSFIENASPSLVAKTLRELWKYREGMEFQPSARDDDPLRDAYFAVVARFEGANTGIDTTAIEAFEKNKTLEELVDSIRRDLDAKRPQAALDRLHTYCMKRFASLIRKHGGGDCGKNDPLHSRVGRYLKILKNHKTLTPISDRIVGSSISVFTEFSRIRNDKSLAHDNPNLVESDEARFIFDTITAFLRFSKAIDTRFFED